MHKLIPAPSHRGQRHSEATRVCPKMPVSFMLISCVLQAGRELINFSSEQGKQNNSESKNKALGRTTAAVFLAEAHM